jgi:hypothetical protein
VSLRVRSLLATLQLLRQQVFKQLFNKAQKQEQEQEELLEEAPEVAIMICLRRFSRLELSKAFKPLTR